MSNEKQKRPNTSMEPIAIRIFENQRRYYSDFEPHKKTPFTLVLTNESCNSLEDFDLVLVNGVGYQIGKLI